MGKDGQSNQKEIAPISYETQERWHKELNEILADIQLNIPDDLQFDFVAHRLDFESWFFRAGNVLKGFSDKQFLRFMITDNLMISTAYDVDTPKKIREIKHDLGLLKVLLKNDEEDED